MEFWREERGYLQLKRESTVSSSAQLQVGSRLHSLQVHLNLCSERCRKPLAWECVVWCVDYGLPPSPTGGSSSASSSDDEVKEAFESCLPSPLDHTPDHTLLSPVQRPIRVAPSGCRKRVPKYFAQMASTEPVERPRLDFNKMQSKRLVMVRCLLCHYPTPFPFPLSLHLFPPSPLSHYPTPFPSPISPLSSLPSSINR